MASLGPSVGIVSCTELVYDVPTAGSPVTFVAGMFAGSTVDITGRYSSVVNGFSCASHCSDVMPAGWCTQAAAHDLATRIASPFGAVGVGVASGVDSRVGRFDVGTGAATPGGVTVAEVVVPGVVGDALACGLPITLGSTMPSAVTRIARNTSVPIRWRGERSGQPHRRR